MSNYFRITAYHKESDISVILDSSGRFEKLWEFSSFLVGKGFSIIEVCKGDMIVKETLPSVKHESNMILLLGIGKGKPEISELEYQDRPCKSIAVFDKVYGQYLR